MQQYILYIIDTETTGLDPSLHEIVELSAFRVSLEDESKNEQKTWLIQAKNKDSISDEALKINGHKKEDILHLSQHGKDNYLPPDKAIEQIEQWIAEDDMSALDRVFVGQNPLFDFNMMEALWKRENAKDTFPFKTGHNKLIVDTKQIAMFIDIAIGVKRERYNLESLVKDFGVKKEKAHRADGDVRMTKDLILTQINGLKESALKNFKKD